jgi:WD40 repeat protein/serine/threonine protein kinase
MGAHTATSMNSTRTCDRCGAVVPAHAPDNLCLGCLFDSAEDSNPDSFGAPGAAGPSRSETKLPSTFGEYELLGELGRGGQGVVYRARHRGLGRLVALKTIPPAHLAGTHARERFHLEASAASRLDHPNIVPIYDVGERDGFCFYSMKLVEGTTIQQLVSGGVPNAVDCRHAAAILVKVAQGVHHAHQRGVLHRDLKPSNILLDHEHEPYVSDFGLARQTDQDSSLTLSHALIGTPAYLAPEVALGGARQATLAADIYGLGAILYHLLSGRPPFVGPTVAETLRALQDDEPVRPGKLNSAVPADLETICLKCLEKEPVKRYGTAQELAEDLARFLRDEPIHARAVTRAEQVWRWCRRKPAFASSLFLILILILIVLIGLPIAAYRINRERQRAEKGELRAMQVAYASDMNLAHEAVQKDNLAQALELLDRHRPLLGVPPSGSPQAQDQASDRLKAGLQTDLRGWEWRYLWRQCQGEERFVLGEHRDGASAVGMLANGKTVFSAGSDKMVRLWDLESRHEIGLLPHSQEIAGAAASPDGRWLATTPMNDPYAQPVLLWDLATQKLAATLTTNFSPRIGSITFSPDSQRLAFGTRFGGLRLWDVKARREVTNLSSVRQSPVSLGFAFSPDSRTLAYNENDYGTIQLWDITNRLVVGSLIGHQSPLLALAFSPNSQTLASSSDDRTARLWNVAERRELFQWTNGSGAFTSLAFSPDGRILALGGVGGSARVIRLVDLETALPKAELRGHLKDISSLAFTPDGQTLLSASRDGTIRAWDPVPQNKERSAHVFAPNSMSMEWLTYDGPAVRLSADGRHLLTVYTNQTFSVWDTLRLTEGERYPVPFTDMEMAGVAPGGRVVAFGSQEGEIRLWDRETGQTRFFARPVTNRISRLVFSLDGRYLAVADEPRLRTQMAATHYDKRRTVRVLDLRTGAETHVFSTDGAFLTPPLIFSADARLLVAGTSKGQVKIWHLDRTDGSSGAATFPPHSAWVEGLALFPDTQTVISASGDIRLWDIRNRHESDKLIPRKEGYGCIALSQDGRRLAAAVGRGLIRILDLASHQEVVTLEGHHETVLHLAFTPEDYLISVSKDQLRVWRSASWSEIQTAEDARK